MEKLNINKIEVEIEPRNIGGLMGIASINYFGLRVSYIMVLKNQGTGELFVKMPKLRKNSKSYVAWIPDEEDRINFDDLILARYEEHLEKIERGEVMDNTPLDQIDIDKF